ncbi:MAG: metallophosphoesterase family protein [Rhodocyclales bacterium]|nr:metallophosphoesterase family protein [Rhodocyclales bacterium]
MAAALGALLAFASWSQQSGGDGKTAMQIPTQAGQSLLLRYPYLQTDTPRRMTIMWATARSGRGEVQYRRTGTRQWSNAKSEERKYPSSRTLLTQDLYQHEATIDDLPPDAEFEYRVLHDGTVLAQGIPFKTLPEVGSNSVAFVALADFGTKYSTPRRVRDAIVKGAANGRWQYRHDFVVGVGDIAYYNGSFAEFDSNFFGQMSGKNDLGNGRQSLLTRRPFVAVLGNHEYRSDNENSIPEGFLESFSKPASAGVPEDQRGRYYSFDSGPAHFVVLDSMKFQGRQSGGRQEMLNWLDRDLAATKQRWRIVFLHHPPYAHGPHGSWGDAATNRRLRAELVPVLQKYGVQLALNGHDHLYERTLRMTIDASSHIVREQGCRIVEDAKGTVFLTVGNGGDDLHGRGADNAPCGTDSFNRAMREYGEGYDFAAQRNGRSVIIDGRNVDPEVPAIRHGFTLVNVTDARISAKAFNYEGALLDEFEILP